MSFDIYCALFQTLGQPIQARFQESEERPKAFEDLGKQIQQYMKAVHAFKAKDELYEHLDEADVAKVEKSANEAMEWMNNNLNLQNKRSLTLDPVIKAKDIQAKAKELASICNPIVNKPKPKVELPKEEQKPTEPNGPLDGQGDAGSGTQPPEQGSAPTATDKKLPEMDID